MSARPRTVYKEPSLEMVERVLYIMIRAETNVLHEMILPTGIPTGHYVYVNWKNSQLFYGFIKHARQYTDPVLRKDPSKYQMSQLTYRREWYFDWKGDAIGPMRLPPETVYALARDQAGLRLSQNTKLIEGDPAMNLVDFANDHLYSII